MGVGFSSSSFNKKDPATTGVLCFGDKDTKLGDLIKFLTKPIMNFYTWTC